METVTIYNQTGRDKDSFCVIACLQKRGKQRLDSFRSMCSRIKTFMGPHFLRNWPQLFKIHPAVPWSFSLGQLSLKIITQPVFPRRHVGTWARYHQHPLSEDFGSDRECQLGFDRPTVKGKHLLGLIALITCAVSRYFTTSIAFRLLHDCEIHKKKVLIHPFEIW